MKARVYTATLLCLSVLVSQAAWAEAPATRFTKHSAMAAQLAVSSPPNVIAISAGRRHTCALTDNGKVWCWGDGISGQLGIGPALQFWEFPVEVRSVGGPAVGISAGSLHTCAVLNGGAAWCWGNNSFGQLGDGTTTNRFVPVDVFGLNSGVAAIDAGISHTCARVAVGVQCWGTTALAPLGMGPILIASRR